MASLDEAEILRAFPNKTSPSLHPGNVSSELSQASQVTTMTSIDEDDLLRRYPGDEVISGHNDVAMQDIPTDIDEPAFGTQISTEPNIPMPKKVCLPSKSLVNSKSPSKSILSPKVIGVAVFRDRVVTSLKIKDMEVLDGDISSVSTSMNSETAEISRESSFNTSHNTQLDSGLSSQWNL